MTNARNVGRIKARGIKKHIIDIKTALFKCPGRRKRRKGHGLSNIVDFRRALFKLPCFKAYAALEKGKAGFE